MIELESDKLDGGSVSAVHRRASSRGDNTGLGGLGVTNMIEKAKKLKEGSMEKSVLGYTSACEERGMGGQSNL